MALAGFARKGGLERMTASWGTGAETVTKSRHETKGGRLALERERGRRWACHGLKLWRLWIVVYWNPEDLHVHVEWDREGVR